MALGRRLWGLVVLISIGVCAAVVDVDVDLLRGSAVEDVELVHYDRLDEQFQLEAFFERERSTKAAKGISGGGKSGVIVQTDGSFEEEFSFFFRPDRPYHDIDDYLISLTSSNETVLPNGEAEEDGEFRILGPRIDRGEIDGSVYYNVTYTVIYDQFPGNTVLTAKFEPNPESDNPRGPPENGYEKKFERTVAGVVVYYVDEDGKKVIISGDGRSFTSDFSEEDRNIDFLVYAQFPDKDKSSTSPGANLNGMRVDGLGGNYYGQFDYNENEDCTRGGIWNGETVDLTRSKQKGCGFSFTTNQEPGVEWTGWHFGMELNKFRAGDSSIDLVWDGFADDPENGPYTQTIRVSLQGNPPPVVYYITPDKPFMKICEEEMTVYFFNSVNPVGQVFRLQDPPVEIDAFLPILDSFEEFDNYTAKITFITKPGEGQQLRWKLTLRDLTDQVVDALDKTQNFQQPGFLFDYVQRDNALESIVPNTGPSTNPNGETIVLNGFFSCASVETTRIVFDNLELPSELILWDQSDETKIVFLRPEQSIVGLKASYQVSVRILDQQTSSLTFRYTFPGGFVTIQSSGTTFNQNTNELEICSCCSARFIAVLSNGAIDENPRFEWRVDVDDTTDNVGYYPYLSKEQENSDPALFSQPLFVVSGDEIDALDDLRIPNAYYRFRVDVFTDVKNGSAEVIVRKTTLQKVGVQIVQPVQRSPALPHAPLSAFAIVDVPPCLADVGQAKFKWELTNPKNEKKQYIFSSQNESIILDQSTPTRLGQEIKIKQRDLYYGSGSQNKLSLNVEVAGLGATGYHEVSLDVVPSEMVAKLNGGQTYFKMKVGEALLLDPSESFDPDELFLQEQSETTVNPIRYMWTCQSGTSNRDISQNCNFFDEGTPATVAINRDKVEISASVLEEKIGERMDELGVSEMWIRYRMFLERDVVVGGLNSDTAFARKSPTTSVLIQVVKLNSNLSKLASLRLSDVNNVARDLTAVPYWEENILEPMFDSSLEGRVVWRYDLIAPTVELPVNAFANRAVKSGMVGFRDPQSFSQGDSLPVLFKAGDYSFRDVGYPLTPGTTYTIEVFFSVAGDEGRPYHITFRTLEEPSIIFPPIYTEGFGVLDFDNVLPAYASSSFESSLFAFYFYAKNLDRPDTIASWMCLATCTGDPYIQFSLAISGTYEIWAQITDVNGQNILAEKKNDNLITVQSSISGSDLVQMKDKVRELYEIGADGDINTLTSAVAVAIKDATKATKSGLISAAQDVSAERTEFLQTALNIMSQVSQLSIPFPGQNRQITQTTCSYASLDEEDGVILDDADVYKLVDMFYFAMEQASATIKYDPDVLSQLTCIYYRLERLLDEAQQRNPTRRRLLQSFDNRRYQEVRLEFYEAFWTVTILLQTRSQGCGYEGNGLTDQVVADFVGDNQVIDLLSSTFTVKVVCTSEQKVTEWEVPTNDGKYGGKITICDEAYAGLQGSGSRDDAIIVALGLQPAYMRDAAIQQVEDEMLTLGVARVGLYRVIDGVLTEVSLGQISQCFKFEMETDPRQRQKILSYRAVGFEVLKEFDVPMEQDGGYFREEDKVDVDSAALSTSNETVFFSAVRFGVFGVDFRQGFQPPLLPTPSVSQNPGSGDDNAPPGLSGIAITGIVIGSLLFLLLLVLILFLFFIRLPASAAPLAGAPAAMPIYVDRDVYGRASMFDLEEADPNANEADLEEIE